MGIYKDLNDYEIMYMVEENDDAKDVMFEKYRPIVLKIATSYKQEGKKYGLELDDLIQEGYLGLYNAMVNYDPNKDSLFYTYAVVSIRSKILNIIRSYSAKRHYCLNSSISFYDEIFASNDAVLYDVISDKNALIPEDILIGNELSKLLSDFIFSTDIEVAAILELKLNGFSYADIGDLLDKSIKSITNTAFRNIRKLKSYLSKNYKLISR